jgi:tetratricopeptide (TPR) repeat protein
MFKAIKLATPESLGKNKKKNDFDNRKKSVEALHDAFNRIAKDESDKESSNKINKQVQQLESGAINLFSMGKEDEARAELDKAYHLLKVSIETFRRGKTLVRSLNFSSKEEEYHYEVDRNDTHKMLINILLKDKTKSEYTSKMVSKYTSSSDDIRKQAEIAAENDSYEEAVKLLEQSTRELVRAIRSAGVYIPG